MDKKSNHKSVLSCPATGKELHQLGAKELEVLKDKLTSRELVFYSGIPVNVEIQEAYSTSNYQYIYPVINGVLLCKTQTTIVAKNRIINPHHRRTEVDINSFYQEYSLGSVNESNHDLEKEEALSQLDLGIFIDRIPKVNPVLVTANANAIESVLNCLYGNKIDQHIHLDHDLRRLKRLKEGLPSDVRVILVDKDKLPFAVNSINTFLNFEAIDLLTKEEQLDLYDQAKDKLCSEGLLISSYHQLKELHLKKRLITDTRKDKTLSFLAPWKKRNSPQMIFCQVGNPSKAEVAHYGANKASFSQQLG